MIRIQILGSAAGGGLPQWNCACVNCLAAREGKIDPQTQSSVAISAQSGEFHSWWLINASPDLPRQIENTTRLQPRHKRSRNTPIAGVLLTNADIDHALGVLLLRQQEKPLVVYATAETQAALAWLDRSLERFCGIQWRTVTPEFQSLDIAMAFRAIELPGSVAFQFRDDTSGRTALFAPSVGSLTEQLRDAVDMSDLVIFDGTFWSNEELGRVRPGARSAREMNHIPINDGSFNLLRQSRARRKIYMHINNTNPIFMSGSCERAQIEQAGIEVAHDGLEIIL